MAAPTQSASTSLNGSSIAVSLGARPALGTTVAIFTTSFATALTGATATDNATTPSTFALVAGATNEANNARCRWLCAQNLGATTGTYTVTVSGGSVADRSLSVHEVDGVLAASVDQGAGGSAASTATWPTGTTATTTQAAETVLIGCTHTGPDTPNPTASGYTIAAAPIYASTFNPNVVGYKQVAATGAQSGSWSGSTTTAAGAAIITLKEAAPFPPFARPQSALYRM